jgi:hypothetical protein
MRTSPYTRSGTRRAGDDYQDLVALDLLVEMLGHPDRYQWVRVEADDARLLDDVVALRADGQIIARQVKYSTNPSHDSDPWTWEKLLAQAPSKTGDLKQSLLQRWAFSIPTLLEWATIAEASVFSNRRAAPDVAVVLGLDGRVDFDRIAPETQAKIVEQLETEATAREFLGTFLFRLGEPDLDVLEDGLRRRFFGLGGTEQGWLSLKDDLRQWIRRKDQPAPDGAITVQTVRAAAGWHSLRALLEQFEVPPDYTLPSEEFHSGFLSDVTTAGSGCRVLDGVPGLGKSTYLSFLVDELEKSNIPVIRHHYFLSTKDGTVGRLDHRSIAESLMSDLENRCRVALGDLASKNPNAGQLREWIETCGKHFAAEGKALVVIIDGLDHVWRERNSRTELDALFEYLLPSPEGVVVVVGTQPVDDQYLPARLLRESPREEWRRLPLLDMHAVWEWLGHHEEELDLPDDQDARDRMLERLARALFERSGGHPLHLRYTLATLQSRGLRVTPEAIGGLPSAADGDIERYYDELWRAIPGEGQEILHLLSAARFQWPRRGLIDCLREAGYQEAQVWEALRQVFHLLVQDPLGLRVFHNSLLVYVAEKEEHADRVRRLQQATLEWLKSDAPSYWQWAYEWLLEADAGNAEPLLNGPSRSWVVEAIIHGYPAGRVDEILGRCCGEALSRQDFSRFVEVGLLQDYFWLAREYRREVLAALLRTQLRLEDVNEDGCLRLRLHASPDDLEVDELVGLARDSMARGDQGIVEACFEKMNQHPSHLVPETEVHMPDAWRSRLVALTRVVAMMGIEAGRVSRFAGQFTEVSSAEEALEAYSRTLRAMRSMQAFRDILGEQLAPSARVRVLRHAVMAALEEGADLPHDLLVQASDPYTSMYAGLRGHDLADRSTEPPSVPENVRAYDSFDRRALVNFFHGAFFYLLTCSLKADDAGKLWISNTGADPWLVEVLSLLNGAAARVAAVLAQRNPASVGPVYSGFSDFARPTWFDDRAHADQATGLAQALCEIALDLLSVSRSFGKPTIGQEDLEMALSTRYFDPWTFIAAYVDAERRWMADETVTWLLHTQEADLEQSVDEFTTRASCFAALASLASLHEMADDAQRFVRRAAENLLTYGEHKDLLLDSALEIVQVCHQAGAGEPEDWLLALAPAIAAVGEFTDGDETGHLPRKLGEVLARVSPHRLPSYYHWLCACEDYEDALAVFHAFLESADLTDPVNQALALTAVDDGSLAVLRDRAEKGDAGAKGALEVTETLLGPLATNSREEPEAWPDQSAAGQPSKIDPLSFPPPSLEAYLEATDARSPYDQGIHLSVWLKAWRDSGRAGEAFEAVRRMIDTDSRLNVGNEIVDVAMACLGRQAAYPWLVRAQRDRHGWNRFYYQKEDAIQRWETVREHYHDLWSTFVVDSMGRGSGQPWESLSVADRVLRLSEYFVFMDRPEAAVQVARQVVESVLKLVSPLRLSNPTWLNDI